MEGDVYCDACGESGHRPTPDAIAPAGWKLHVVRADGEVFYVRVCSEFCASAFWSDGPGRRGV